MAWLVLINYQTQADEKVLRQAGYPIQASLGRGRNSANAEAAIRHQSQSTETLPLVGGEFLLGDLPRSAVLVRIFHLGPKLASLILLAFRDVEIGQIQLRHVGRHG